ncbi:MAG: YihY/virulence factor BrkB family protein [Phycisphaerales bacterium]
MNPIRATIDGAVRLLESPEKELTRWQRAGRDFIELSIHCARQLRAIKAQQMGAALTYRTVFSLVPTFVLGLVVLRFFSTESQITSQVEQLMQYAGLDNLQIPQADGESAMTAADWVETLVQRIGSINFAAIGIVGVIVLVYAGVSLLLEIERAFNAIYRTEVRRSLVARISRSWTILTLGPIGLLASFYVGEQFRSIVETVGGQAVVSLAGVLVTFTISWLLLLLAYTVVPDARVRLRPALIGAFVAAVLWEAGKFAFREYLGFATGYARFYGSLALIPIFLLWVYITWLCVLFGIQLSQAIQTLRPGHLLQDIDRTGPIDPLLRVALLVELARSFDEGRVGDPQALADRLEAPESVVLEALARLDADDLVARVMDDEGEFEGYALARPAASILARDVVANARRTGASGVLGELRRRQGEALGDRSIADLAAAVGD